MIHPFYSPVAEAVESLKMRLNAYGSSEILRRRSICIGIDDQYACGSQAWRCTCHDMKSATQRRCCQQTVNHVEQMARTLCPRDDFAPELSRFMVHPQDSVGKSILETSKPGAQVSLLATVR
jgi:hypothetical protein